jgi:hypothetical protein
MSTVPTSPRPGRAARWRAWRETHPRLYAARHPVLQLLGTAAALLGIGALVRAFVAGLLPHISLPDLSAPEWLRYLDPARYLAPLFGWVAPLLDQLLGWAPELELGWAKYVIGFLVAVTVGVREARRRRRVATESAADRQHNDSP